MWTQQFKTQPSVTVSLSSVSVADVFGTKVVWLRGQEAMFKGSRVGAVVEHSPSTNVARVRFPDSAS